MEIINSTDFAFAPLIGRVNFPEYSLTLIVKGTFNLEQGGTATLAGQQLYPTGDEPYPDDEEQRTVRYESDFACYKPHADLLLVGTCHTPGNRPQPACRVTFQAGDAQSTLAVFGNRYWHRMTGTISSPEPFTAMELRYENSFGGPGYEKNPLGKGIAGTRLPDGTVAVPLPNIEHPGRLITSPDSRPEPAGFAPLHRMWQQRVARLGTYDHNWQEQRWPWFPADFNWEYCNAAPRAMQLGGYLRGDEPLFFENLHPEIARYRSRLPGLRVRCFLHRYGPGGSGELRFDEVTMHLDTLWVDMDAEKLILVWRGLTDIEDEKYQEVEHLFIVSEDLSDTPRPAAEWYDDFQAALAAEEAVFADESPEETGSKGGIEEELLQVEEEVQKAQEMLNRELEAAGIEPVDELPEPSREDREAEARILAEYGLEEMLSEKPLTRDTVVRKVAAGESFAEEVFAGLDLSGLDLRGGDFQGVFFQDVNLKDALLDEANLKEAHFENTDLSRASLRQVDATDADFSGARLSRADLRESLLEHAIFEHAALDRANLENARAAGSFFARADLSGARLKNGCFDGADFSCALLDGADFAGASLREASVEGARGSNLSMMDCDLTELRASEGCSFVGGDFRQARGEQSTWEDAVLTGADFSAADMMGADFSSARLERANFLAADLKQARFTGANLASAVCRTANLFEACFEKADLTGTDCSGSNLYGAEFLQARLQSTVLHGANLKMTKLAGKEGRADGIVSER